MARVRIREFASSQPSQTVGSLPPRILSELNQEGRNDDYDSSHHNGHAGKQHGVDNDSDHSRSPFLRPRYTNAYLGAMVASVADTVFFAPWPLRNMYATRRVNG